MARTRACHEQRYGADTGMPRNKRAYVHGMLINNNFDHEYINIAYIVLFC